MTREEAIRVLDLNGGRLSNSVQQAIATVVQDGEKIRAVKAVLTKRKEIIDRRVATPGSGDVEYYLGKRDGYFQALELLNETLESIKIELD